MSEPLLFDHAIGAVRPALDLPGVRDSWFSLLVDSSDSVSEQAPNGFVFGEKYNAR